MSAQKGSGASPLDVDAVLDLVLSSAGRLFRGEGGSIMLLIGPEELEVMASPANPAALGAKVRFGEGVAGLVAKTGEPALVEGRDDTRTKPVESGMSVPLMHEGRLFGVINLNAMEGRTFTAHDLVSAKAFASQAANALAQARLYEVDRREGAARPQDHLDDLLRHLRAAASIDFVEPGDAEPIDANAEARTVAEKEDKAGRPTGVRGPASAMVLGRSEHLRWALKELIDNGHRHGEGPVRLILENGGDDFVVLTVADSGPGIPETDRDAIFEPYGRLDRDTDSDGLGLGLTIAQKLIEDMGGSISVGDTPVGGAAFRVRLRAA